MGASQLIKAVMMGDGILATKLIDTVTHASLHTMNPSSPQFATRMPTLRRWDVKLRLLLVKSILESCVTFFAEVPSHVIAEKMRATTPKENRLIILVCQV